MRKKEPETRHFGMIFCLLLCLTMIVVGTTEGCMSRREEDTDSRTPKQEELGKIKDVSITLRFGSDRETLRFEDIRDMVEIQKENGAFQYRVHEDKLKEYIHGILAKKTDLTEDTVSFTSHDGKTRTLSNRAGKWKLDENYAFEKLKETIEKAGTLSADLTSQSEESAKWWKEKGYVYGSPKDNDGTYIEVSIEQQHLWLYRQNRLMMDSPVITGNPNTSHGTPEGAFVVFDKEQNALLSGEDYETEVSYWVEFTDAVGIHDAIWQADFGGELYLTVGSHGCVNLPFEKAKQVYGLAYLGMPVYIYS